MLIGRSNKFGRDTVFHSRKSKGYKSRFNKVGCALKMLHAMHANPPHNQQKWHDLVAANEIGNGAILGGTLSNGMVHVKRSTLSHPTVGHLGKGLVASKAFPSCDVGPNQQFSIKQWETHKHRIQESIITRYYGSIRDRYLKKKPKTQSKARSTFVPFPKSHVLPFPGASGGGAGQWQCIDGEWIASALKYDRSSKQYTPSDKGSVIMHLGLGSLANSCDDIPN